jgi:hypothetical protein
VQCIQTVGQVQCLRKEQVLVFKHVYKASTGKMRVNVFVTVHISSSCDRRK